MNLEERMRLACDVCGNWPDENGCLEHGKGCYVLSEDGGGEEFIEEAVEGEKPEEPK